MGAFIFFSRAMKSIGICYSVQPLFCGRESMNSLGGANDFPRAPFCWGPPCPVFPKTLFPCVVFAITPPRLHHSGVCPRRFTPGLPPSVGRCGRRLK